MTGTVTATEPGGDARQRARLHSMWASVADRWEIHADELDASRADVTAALLARAALRPGDRVLELACGPGGTGLAAAPLVGPRGEVVLTDVVPAMTRIAARRAAASGLTNVRTRDRDLEDIAEPSASFDAVLCREGLMFAADPARAAVEIARVLGPGGRVALAVWGPRERNPWLGLLFDAASAEVGRQLPPPGGPGPFALADADLLARTLRKAGLAGVVVEDLSVPMRTASFHEWWTRTTALAGPLSEVLAGMPHERREALEVRLRHDLRPYLVEAGGLDLPGVTLLATARRP